MTRKLDLDGRPARATNAARWASARPRSSAHWGPDRFAQGTLEALDLARRPRAPAQPPVDAPRGKRDEAMMRPRIARPVAVDGSDRRQRRRTGRVAGWLHLCNGLDPVRDGGHGAEHPGDDRRPGPAGRRRDDRDAHALAARARRASPDGVTLEGPETDLEAAVRSAEVVHMHGLWQGHTRRGARAARAARVPYLIAAHGMAEPWALRHKRWKKRLYLALVEAKNLRRAACLHALSRPEIGHLRELAPWTPVCFVPNGVDLAPFDDLPAAVGPRSASIPSSRASSCSSSSAGSTSRRGSTCWPRPWAGWRPTFPDLHLLDRRQGRRRLVAVLATGSGELGLTRRVTYVGPRGRRAGPPGLGRGRRLHPAQLQRGLQHGHPRGPGLLAPLPDHDGLPLPRAGRGRRGHRRRARARRRHARALRDLLERIARGAAAARARTAGGWSRRDYTWDQQAERLASVYRLARGRRSRRRSASSLDARRAIGSIQRTRSSSETTTMSMR